MFLVELFVTRIRKDFQQKELLPVKLLFFVHASTLFVLYPYLTIHMRELGINVEETAIMSAVIPIVAIVMPPIAGMVADRIGNFRILLAIFSALGGGVSLLLLLVPVGRVIITHPDRVILDIGCSDARVDGTLLLNMNSDQSCNFVKRLRNGTTHQVEITLEACGFSCKDDIGGLITPMLPSTQTSYVDNTEDSSQNILRTHSYDVIVNSAVSNVTETYSYTLNPESIANVISSDKGDPDLRSRRFRKNNDFYQTSVRRLSKTSYFFPTAGLYNLTCVLVNETYSQVANATGIGAFITYQCKFGSDERESEEASRLQMSRKHFRTNLILSMNDEARDNSSNMFSVKGLNNWTIAEKDSAIASKMFGATCNDIYTENNHRVRISLPIWNTENITALRSIIQLSNCNARCLVTIPRSELCSNQKTEELYDIQLTFWTYLVVRVFIGMIGGTAFAMFEGAVIAILRQQNADYGLQRIYATIGGMISSPLSGLLIDYASRGKGYTDFRPAFYLYAGLKIASGVLMLTMNLDFKAPATSVVTDVVSVLKNVEIVALFIAIFVLGTAWGYIESFLFWLLQDLGGSQSLMGITITVGGIAGIPLLVLSGPIIDKIGHANVLFIGFIFYAIRLIGYSLIYNPWLCLIFEAMESVTSSLSFTAAVTYAAKLSTSSTDSSIQGLLGGLYFGVGKGAGSLIGGYMMKAFGTRPTYRIFAVACVVTGFAYFLFNKFYLHKRSRIEVIDTVLKNSEMSKSKDLNEIDSIETKKVKESTIKTSDNSICNSKKHEMISEDALSSKRFSTTRECCNPSIENNAKNVDMEKEYNTSQNYNTNIGDGLNIKQNVDKLQQMSELKMTENDESHSITLGEDCDNAKSVGTGLQNNGVENDSKYSNKESIISVENGNTDEIAEDIKST